MYILGFCIVTMLGYIVLDFFGLGAGVARLLIARDTPQRHALLGAGTSLLLTVLYGAAMGDVIRRVPAGATPAILDWFTVLCAATTLIVFTSHSALRLACKTEGGLRDRCRHFAERIWWAVGLALSALAAASLATQPHIANLDAHPWIFVFAVVALAGLLAIPLCLREQYELGALAGSSVMIAGLICCAAVGHLSNT